MFYVKWTLMSKITVTLRHSVASYELYSLSNIVFYQKLCFVKHVNTYKQFQSLFLMLQTNLNINRHTA